MNADIRTEGASTTPHRPATRSALLVTGRPTLSANARRRLSSMGIPCETRSDARRAAATLREGSYDLLIIDDSFPPSVCEGLIEALRERDPSATAVWLAESASVAETVAAMRIGFDDILSLPLREEELALRLDAASRRQETIRRSQRRLARWRLVCRQLNAARHEADRAASEARGDLDQARAETVRQVEDAVLSSEFRTLLRQELEVESLLRTAMEYLLTKTGPTNAAVFLNNGGSKWGLGAYVNYRIPRASISVVLDRIAEQVCPQVAGQTGILRFTDVAEFVESVGPEGEPLKDQEVVSFGCHHEGECLAVVVLFRDRREAFREGAAATLDLMRSILAAQMASIVRIHHRSKPQWPDEATDAHEEGGWDAAA